MTSIRVYFLAMAIFSSVAGCLAELAETDDTPEQPQLLAEDPQPVPEAEPVPLEEALAPDINVTVLNLYDDGQIDLSGGLSGKSEDRVVSTTCPGFQRTFFEATKLSEAGTCNVVNWFSQDSSDCRIIVHTGVSSFRNVSCAWKVYADQLGVYTYNATNTNSAQQNTIDTRIPLDAGNTIEVGTCGLPGASAFGDTYLRLISPTGVTAALNDDECLSRASRLIFTVPPGGAGRYTVKAGCFLSGSCGGSVAWQIR